VVLNPEVLLQGHVPAQRPLPLSTEGVVRLLWESRFGPILIEVVDGVCFVNRERVEPALSVPKG
jgi:hypothetical protein